MLSRLTTLFGILLASLALASAATSTALADEGMWTFDNFPSATVKAKYGVTIDQAWLDHVRGAAVRLSVGCSASLVSGQGLVMTNHHCVQDCLEDLSGNGHDYVKDGFSTAAKTDEKLCPGLQAEILLSSSDVTATINAKTSGKNGTDFVRARDAAVAALEKDSCAGKETAQRCQVISLYQGGQYWLYVYRRYSDVRLVFAVEFDTGFFGGDPDNFSFPRYDEDVSFLRIYDNGKPESTPNHLKWSTETPKEGEPVFVAGNPGGTSRLLSATQLAGLRDVSRPSLLLTEAELRGRIIRFGEESAEHDRIAVNELFGLENALKAMRGEEAALMDSKLFDGKRRADAELQAKVKADPKLSADIGDPWSEVAAAERERAALYPAYFWLEARAGWDSTLYHYARILVRAAAERAKPNDQRLREYADARLPLVEKQLLDASAVEHDIEQLKLEFWLSKLRENLTADAPETKIFLGRESPEDLSRTLSDSKLADPTFRKALWEGGEAAITSSDDPLIQYVRKVDATSRAARAAYEDRVSGPEDRANERIAWARFAAYGSSVYPDASFSLRLSYGAVSGWNENGKTIAATTQFGGLYTRATGKEPFKLAPRWIAAQSKLNPNTVFNFTSTNDIIGGNSGSPVLNAKGDVIGAAFDGNLLSLGGEFFYDGAANRTVSVSTVSITEALDKVYGAKALLTELTEP